MEWATGAIAAVNWPVAAIIIAVAFAVIFRSPLTALIHRVRRAGTGSTSLDFEPSQTAAQQKHPAELGGAIANRTAQVPLPSEVFAPIEQEIQTALQKAAMTPDVERAWLIRTIAQFRVMYAHEMSYRLILGSQLSLIVSANTPAPPNVEVARTIYAAAKDSFPEMYADFSFENWLQWPLNTGLIRLEPNGANPSVVKITPGGRDFLHYLVESGLTSQKSG